MSKNRTILIIGAKSDIAVAVAHKFASEGYNLQLAARNSLELDAVVSDLKIRYEINVSVYELDILQYETFTDFIDSLECQIGRAHVRTPVTEKSRMPSSA